MEGRLLQAIKTRWTDQSLGSSFPGGLWLGKAPPGTSWPHVVMIDLGKGREFATSGDEQGQRLYMAQSIQFSIWYKADEDGATDPVEALAALMRTLDGAMLYAPMSVPASEGSVPLFVKTTSEIMLDDEDERAYHGMLEYDARLWEIVDANPS